MTPKPVKPSNTVKLLELRYNMDIESLLRSDYLDGRMTINQMADKYGIAPCTVHKFLVKYRIPRRRIKFDF